MKKIFLILVALILISILNNAEEEIIIPKNAIRYRVIANSNSNYDQEEKKKVATKLGNNIKDTLINANSLDEARFSLKRNINTFTNIVSKQLKQDNYQEEINIDYGQNYFPEKHYKGVTYKEGEYESLVVTLGKGQGENFWCVLFPPLCLLEGEEEDTNKVEYKSFVKELIDKYFS